ncbi:roquin-2-like isoform X2 [Polyodon spathula]|uniref:roquin-2-like isoform X2 n=1 Tax=Polyodon spathula TaxID=7913 RepID=UPI001B7DC66D|nr:roquin-2-like isoform X2 [Polyodon spathula]
MPVQAAQWTEFLSCPICYSEFDESKHKPISLGCSHTVCKTCLNKLQRKACPFDQTVLNTDIDALPVNFALLQLVGAQVPDQQTVHLSNVAESKHYEAAKKCVEELALFLKPLSGGKGVASLSQSALSRPMQRKLVTLVTCQLVEEEGRLRALRAARSLGERTVTELILQHQSPQQLSANLWAAVRARGCQFLGPAMQEDALKLVLLALEDGSALSRKVLVLFVVQKLEARFPQASKTSIGHVVQLLYRASCFKVTKRDEDSSLMQLKEEFRTYEALRREHDAQIVHIAMEAGLRISPEQWSSLLYGDLAHKSHMQSIIDKLQSPESFAKSVQELTIVLQRTGDPANLNRLSPHLELLANIDHNPDAAPSTWEQLEDVMVAVKTVVHGLVDFIQNFSKKGHETPQPQPNSKYKTSMCRDLRQQGGCPRGANCTFAHAQEELEKYRMRNKKISASVRRFPVSQVLLGNVGVNSTTATTVSGSTESMGEMIHSTNGVHRESSEPQLIPRGADSPLDELKKLARGGSSGLTAPCCLAESPPESKMLSPCKTPVNPGTATSTVPPSREASMNSVHSNPGQFVSRVSLCPRQQSDVYYLNPQTAVSYDAPPSQTMPYTDQYPSFPPQGRMTSSPCPPPPPQQYSYPAVHSGMYAPVYDSRRMWRPQMYHRDDVRSSSLPPMDVVHSSIYQPPLRERYSSLDGYYSVAGQAASEQRAVPLQRDSCNRMAVGYDELFRRKPDQWTQCHSQKPPLVSPALPLTAQSPSPSSPHFNVDFSTEFSSDFVGSKYKEDDRLSHYSPWSCGTIGTCIHAVDSEPKDVVANSSMELTDHNSSDIKRRTHLFEPQRRLRDEDPIIPFGEGPIISKWGAISRSSRTGYHTTDPIQATASQGSTTKPINFRDYGPYINHSDSRWSAYESDSSAPSNYMKRDQLRVSGLTAKDSCNRDHLSTELQQAASNSLLLQKEANALATQQKWASLEDELSFSLIGSKIALRNTETGFTEDSVDSKPDRDIELELSALDADEPDAQDEEIEEALSHQLCINSHNDKRSNGTVAGNGHQPIQQDSITSDKVGNHILKQTAINKKQRVIQPMTWCFSKAMTPAGGVSSSASVTSALSISKLVLKTATQGDLTKPATNGEMLLNGS